MFRNRFPPRVPRMILSVIVRRGRPAPPAGHDLLLHFHFVLLDDLDPFFVLVGIRRRPALVFLMLLHLLLFLAMLLVLLLGRSLLFRIALRIRPGTDVLLLVLPAAAAAGTFLALPATPLHLQILRAGTVRLGRIRRARAGAALVLFLRFAHRAAPESIIPWPKSVNETLQPAQNSLYNLPEYRY